MIKNILKIAKWLLIVYVLLLIGAYFFQEKLIFYPEELSQDYKYTLTGDFEEINLTTVDNAIINALHLKVDDTKGVILYFHGNAGNLERWSKVVSFFTQFDYDVFVIDYRNYGKSTGVFNEEKMFKDAQLCYDYVKGKYKENDIVVYGRSLGTTFATKVASNNSPKQLILEAPFFSLLDIAKQRYSLIPSFLLKYKFQTDKYIKKVKCSVTIFHGTDDWVTPYEGGKRLFDEVIIDNKQFITIENAGHNNLIEYDLYKEKLKRLLN